MIDAIEARERSVARRLARRAVRGVAGCDRVWTFARLVFPTPFTHFARRLAAWGHARVVVMRPAMPDARAVNALLITHDLSSSGAPKIVCEIADILRSASLGVTVVSPTPGPMSSALMALGVTVVIDPRALTSRSRTLSLLGGIADIVVCNTVVTRRGVRSLSRTKPVLWYLHEVSLVQELLEEDASLALDLMLPAELWCGSELSAALVRPHRPDTRVVPYGLVPLARMPRDQSAMINGRRARIGIFGSIEPRKGQDLAVDALGHLAPAECELIELVMYGRHLDPDMVAQIRQRAAGLPVTIGDELDAHSYRRALLDCDVVLVASRDDTLPLVSLDALGAGLVLACTPTTGTAAYLKDGVSGFVAQAASGPAIAAMLSTALAKRSHWACIGESAKDVFAASFSKSRFTEHVMNFVEGSTSVSSAVWRSEEDNGGQRTTPSAIQDA